MWLVVIVNENGFELLSPTPIKTIQTNALINGVRQKKNASFNIHE